MDIKTIILIAVSVFAAAITFFLTKSAANKKFNQFKNAEEALQKLKEDHDQLTLDFDKLSLDHEELIKNNGALTIIHEELLNRTKIQKELLAQINIETKELQALKGRDDEFKRDIQNSMVTLEKEKRKLVEIENKIKNGEIELNELMGYLDLYSRIEEYTSQGHFDMPQYLYETTARYAEEIKEIRKQQQAMIKNNTAVTYPADAVISNDKTFNAKILNGQIKLMLTAFNIECDMLIGKVSPSSFARTLERIEKLANNLEKSAASLSCGFNIDYVELKYEECKLQYEFTLKKQEEATEQALIKEQIREEQKAIREYEKAIADAEKEEKMYRSLLDKAQQELAKATDQERSEMEMKIAILEKQLLEAQTKEERAKSMAEQTRKGHVYIISNIGSFGENVYKIGLTRRLEPMDRVKELGDASVPFPFDVHAMIYTEDAPALETSLHREFHANRVNAVNLRKEFFNVDLHDIKDAVERIAGFEAEFKMTALAEDYYESLRLVQAA